MYNGKGKWIKGEEKLNKRRRKTEFDWNDKYRELSNEIHSPIHIPSILPLFFKNKPYVKIKNVIKRKRIRPLINKNIKTPFSLSSNPFILSNWESKVITTYNKNSKSGTKTTLLKTIKIKIRPNKDQRDVILYPLKCIKVDTVNLKR